MRYLGVLFCLSCLGLRDSWVCGFIFFIHFRYSLARIMYFFCTILSLLFFKIPIIQFKHLTAFHLILTLFYFTFTFSMCFSLDMFYWVPSSCIILSSGFSYLPLHSSILNFSTALFLDLEFPLGAFLYILVQWRIYLSFYLFLKTIDCRYFKIRVWRLKCCDHLWPVSILCFLSFSFFSCLLVIWSSFLAYLLI